MKLRFGATTRLDEDHCPVCKHKLDAASVMTSAKGKPEVGDFSVCINCASALRFDIGLHLRIATKEDLRDFYDNQPAMFAAMCKLTAVTKAAANYVRSKKYRRN